jgi:hypothetical protein
MDIAMLLGGTVIAMLQGMDPEGVKRSIATLHKLANRESCSPAERHIFQTIAEAVENPLAPAPTVRRSFEVIQGGAA